MKIFVLYIVCLVAVVQSAMGQYQFSGKIEYERKKNLHGLYRDEEWFEKYKATTPKMITHYFDMYFDTTRTLYKPGKEVDNPNTWLANQPAADNIVYSDFSANKVTETKIVYEQKFLLEDSVRKLAWKEKDDLRVIAGHQCHKAVAVIFDTVYVVAFYAEDIPISGGPEMFGGLPGMILELAIPRLHTTWTATHIDIATPTADEMKIPTKGKKTNSKALIETLKESFKDWGTSGTRNTLWTML